MENESLNSTNLKKINRENKEINRKDPIKILSIIINILLLLIILRQGSKKENIQIKEKELIKIQEKEINKIAVDFVKENEDIIEYEPQYNNEIKSKLRGFLEMSENEGLFLNGLIRKYKPKKNIRSRSKKRGFNFTYIKRNKRL